MIPINSIRLPDRATIDQRAALLPPEAPVADHDVDKVTLSTSQKAGLIALDALSLVSGSSEPTTNQVRLNPGGSQAWQGNGPIAVFDTETTW